LDLEPFRSTSDVRLAVWAKSGQPAMAGRPPRNDPALDLPTPQVETTLLWPVLVAMPPRLDLAHRPNWEGAHDRLGGGEPCL